MARLASEGEVEGEEQDGFVRYIWDAITYEGDTWGHAAVSVAFEWGMIALVGLIVFYCANP